MRKNNYYYSLATTPSRNLSFSWALCVCSLNASCFYVWLCVSLQFSYNGHKSQIKMLKHHSDNARQKITMKCKDQPLYFDKGNSTIKKSVILMSFDEEEVKARGKAPFRYRKMKDTCEVWSISKFVIFSQFTSIHSLKRFTTPDNHPMTLF